MQPLPRPLRVLALGLLVATCPAGAEPWLQPGNTALRNDLQLLADAAVIRAPLNTWPLSWADIAREVLGDVDHDGLDDGELAALQRVRRAARRETAWGRTRTSLRISAAAEPRVLRTFEDTPREEAELRAAVDWTGMRFSYRLQLTAVADADDDRDFRADGSYLGVALGNFVLSASAVDRWWGPGWDSSLLLGTNARPIPALALRRNYADPFEAKWLRWVGPWNFSIVWGQLESGRTVPDARFFGARFTFRPLSDLEIGVSRTAQWCGEGRPCGFDTFVDLLLGRDNRGEDVSLEDEPGNQLAGVDFRWSSPLSDLPFAFYGQVVGEDEAGGLPSRFIAQLGFDWWGRSQWPMPGSFRVRLEASDTAAQFYSEPRFDFAYEHFIYQDGYRYRGRSLGHATDNDSRLISLGAIFTEDSGRSWNALLRVGDLNRGGDQPNTVADRPLDLINVELAHRRPLGPGQISLLVGFDAIDDPAGGSEEELRAHAQWNTDF